MTKKKLVPPRNQTSSTISLIKEVPHGWEVTFTVRRLEGEAIGALGVDGTVVVAVFAHTMGLLRKARVPIDELLDDWREDVK